MIHCFYPVNTNFLTDQSSCFQWKLGTNSYIMITLEKVFTVYPNHQIIGIESIWTPGAGWQSSIEIYKEATAGFSHEARLEKAHKAGAKKVQLILENRTTGNPVWADFAIGELLQPKP